VSASWWTSPSETTWPREAEIFSTGVVPGATHWLNTQRPLTASLTFYRDTTNVRWEDMVLSFDFWDKTDRTSIGRRTHMPPMRYHWSYIQQINLHLHFTGRVKLVSDSAGPLRKLDSVRTLSNRDIWDDLEWPLKLCYFWYLTFHMVVQQHVLGAVGNKDPVWNLPLFCVRSWRATCKR